MCIAWSSRQSSRLWSRKHPNRDNAVLAPSSVDCGAEIKKSGRAVLRAMMRVARMRQLRSYRGHLAACQAVKAVATGLVHTRTAAPWLLAQHIGTLV